MTLFPIPFVAENPDSWGPPEDDGVPKLAALPYAPFGRSDRLGRCADFTRPLQAQTTTQPYDNRRGGGRYGSKTSAKDNHNNNDEEDDTMDNNDNDQDFELVDTTKTASQQQGSRFVTPASKRRQQSQRLRQVNARRQHNSGPTLANTTLKGGRGNTPAGAGRGGFGGGRGGGGRGGGRGGNHNNNWNQKVDRQPSVAVQKDWVVMEELDLAKLSKSLADKGDGKIPEPHDVLWCGFLDHYHDAYDKVTTRAPVALKRMAHKEFYPVTTTDDPVLEKLAIDGVGQVFCTDVILSHLMTCTRSVYPWDLVITKLASGQIFLDKRDNGPLDYLTVHETAHNPPTNSSDENNSYNSPERLGLEATMIHQNFSQQILKKSGGKQRKEMDLPNPFYDEDEGAAEGMEPASVAYRYRQFPLDDQITLVCRTELHGLVKDDSTYMTAFCLNEYHGNAGNTNNVMNWRDKLDQQRGAVLANELKNNSFQLAKWTAQSLLAGADQMKIGYCSRVSPKNPHEHVILATQFYRPKDFATQITLRESQLWSMIRMFIGLLSKHPQGKYVLLREPNRATLVLYQVPLDTFDEDEDEDDDKEDEADEEKDEEAE